MISEPMNWEKTTKSSIKVIAVRTCSSAVLGAAKASRFTSDVSRWSSFLPAQTTPPRRMKSVKTTSRFRVSPEVS